MQEQVTILVGAQWGDEGKGKWVDILAVDHDLVVRFQGGNNAGHTLYIDGEKVVLHQIPSGIFRREQNCALTAGVVVNPGELVKEIEKVRPLAEVTPERLWLSARAHVITPWNIHRDKQKEADSDTPIGTTKRGIGPTYADKAARTGLRLGDFVRPDTRAAWIAEMKKLPAFAAFYEQSQDEWQAFEAAAEPLAGFVCDAESRVRSSLDTGKTLLVEGAQGVLLDIDHGTYPFVTSSTTAAGGAFASLGFSAKRIKNVYGIAKAYLTRVGAGPFPTELNDHVGASIAEVGKEFGATTGRPRRCGWLDAVALRYAVATNGLDGVVLNKLDVLNGLEEIKMAVAYQHPTLGRIDEMPWDGAVLAACEPVYESFRGWQSDVPKSGKKADLPEAARAYVSAVEEAVRAPVVMVGTGPDRENALF